MGEIKIQPIEKHQVEDAKRVILSVGRILYGWEEGLEEIVQRFDESGEISDIDNFQSFYFEKNGIFLVVLDDGQVVGTGAVYRIGDKICELKRLWLLEEYQGKGIGYRVYNELVNFAQENGYEKMWIETGYEQERAIRFYQRLGFKNREKYNERGSDVYMEMDL